MLPGRTRANLEQTLSSAYAAGLLSHDTFTERLRELTEAALIEPSQITGDIVLRGERRRLGALQLRRLAERVAAALPWAGEPPLLLGLDWSGSPEELVIGRDPECDVVLEDVHVSRRHAHLRHRDGRWVLQDLESKNGTVLNGARVGRCQLHPGDRLSIAGCLMIVD